MTLNTEIWHLNDIADFESWLVDEIPLDVVLDPTRLGQSISSEPVTILSESKTTDPNVVIFITQNTNIRYVAVWGNGINKFVNFFINSAGDFEDRLLAVYQKLGIKLKAGVESENLENIINRLYDMTYKGFLEDYDGEKQKLISKFKSMTGREKPGFM